MKHGDISFAPINRLKSTLALNGIAVADCKFYRDRGCLSYYSVGGGYTLGTFSTAEDKVRSVAPFDMTGLIEITNID